MNAQPLFSKQLVLALLGVSIVASAALVWLSFLHLYAYYVSMPIIVAIVASFAVILPVLLYFSLHKRWAVISYIIVLNIASFAAFVCFIGFYSPFVLLWSVIIILSYLYINKITAGLSALLLAIETAFTLYMYRETLFERNDFWLMLAFSICVMLSAMAFGYVFSVLIRNLSDRADRLTVSKHAEEVQLNRLDTLLNSISDTVLTLNRYGRVTSENSAALSFFDTNQSLIGKNIDDLLKARDATLEPFSLRKLASEMHGSTFRDDLSIQIDGENDVMRLFVQLSPIHGKFGDEDSGCVVIIRDITRQKTLEDEKDEFISVTSHELRTPIAIAEGSLSNLVYMFNKGADPKQLAASATAAHDQILYLARMINDLSTLSRAERGVGDASEEIDLNTILQELYLRYQAEADAKSLKLNIDLDHLPTVTTSRLYLEEILQNFLTNAIKYTKEGSVTLSGKLHDGDITFSVTDTGIGINKTDQEKIFEKFFRSEDYRTRETSGTGLGLYVVRKLADKLNTTINVESRLNHGSTFSFTLPLKPNATDTDKLANIT